MKRLQKAFINLCILTTLHTFNGFQTYCEAQNFDSLMLVTKNSEINDSLRYNATHTLILRKYCLTNLDSTEILLDKLIQLTTRMDNAKYRAKTFLVEGQVYRFKNQDSLSRKSNRNALKLSRKLNYKKGEADALRALGVYYKTQGNLDSAMQYYYQSMLVCHKSGYKRDEAKCINNLANVYNMQGNQELALQYHFNCIKIWDEIGEKQLMINSYVNIAFLYSQLNELDLSLRYSRMSLQLADTTGDLKNKATSLTQIGITYAKMDSLSEALAFFKESLGIRKKLNFPLDLALAHINISNVYSQIDSFKQRKSHLDLALNIGNETKNSEALLLSTFSLGNLNYDLKNYKKAKEYYLRSLQFAEKVQRLTYISNVHKSLYKISKIQHKHKQALYHYEKYSTTKDSIYNRKKLKEIVKKQMSFDFEKKETLQQAEFDKQAALKEAEVVRQKQVRNITLAGSALLLVVGGAWFSNYRKKQNIKALLSAEAEKVKRQKVSIQAQEQERKRIAKELHDGLGSFLAGIRMKLLNTNEKNTAVIETAEELSEAYREVRHISHNLMPSAILGEVFVEVVQKYIQGFAKNSAIDVSFEVSPEEAFNNLDGELQVDIYRVVQELMNNIRKHAKADKVEVDISMENNVISLFVEDNGVGFNPQNSKAGIGLKNIEERLKLWNGKLTVDSKEGHGSRFVLEFQAA